MRHRRGAYYRCAMTLPQDFVEASRSAVEAEVEAVVADLRHGIVREEEDFTSQMLSAMKSALRRTSLRGFAWTAAVHRQQSEEPRSGADFAGVLRVDLPDYSVTNGFLAQGKLAGPYKRIDKKRLLEQVERMLDLSPASYVFLFRPQGWRSFRRSRLRPLKASPESCMSGVSASFSPSRSTASLANAV
jgi:hypothetical protein